MMPSVTRILITSMHYAPGAAGPGANVARIAEHLASRGYRVTVAAGLPLHPSFRAFAPYDGRPLREVRRGVLVRRVRHAIPRGGSVAGRVAADASFFARGLSALQAPRPDAVLGFAPSVSSAMLARAAASRFRVPYGLVIDAPSAGDYADRWSASASDAALGLAARAASVVAITDDEMRYPLEAHGVRPERIRRAAQWAHLPDAEADAGLVRQRLRVADDAVLCMYSGPLERGLGLENLIYAAHMAQEMHPGWRFVIAGDGSRRRVLREMLAWYGIRNTIIIAPVPPEFLAAADVLVVPGARAVGAMGAYLGAGRPIVAASERGESVAREITASSCGIVVQPEHPAALVRGVERTAADSALKLYLTQAARRWAVTQRSESRAMQSYEQLVAAVLARGTHGRVHTEARERARRDVPPAAMGRLAA